VNIVRWIFVGLFVTVALVEAFFVFALWDWKSSLGMWQREIDRDRSRCYACVTGASVTSFKNPYQFCNEHRAHWQLIHDLEEGSGHAEVD
jgi:hypothetical protein